jgi:tetratricopeptide (TPR) repeat protein/DNA-binding CsgD family transcriptional regulator
MKVVFVCLIFAAHLLVAQDAKRVDSLKQVVAIHPQDTLGIFALCDLVYEFAPVDFDKAYGYATLSLQIALQLNDRKNEAYALNNIAIAYDFQSKFDKALEYYLKALKVNEEINNQSGVAAGYTNIGLSFYYQNEFGKAEEWYAKALRIREKINTPIETARLYNNMGALFRKQGKYADAIEVYQKSLQIKQKQNDKKGIASTLSNIGIVYRYQGDLAKALDYQYQSLKIEEEIQHPYGISASYITIGEIFNLQKQYPEAQTNYAKGLEVARKSGNKELMQNAYYGLFQNDSLQGNIKASLENYQRYTHTKDEIYNEEKSRQMIQMQTLYETEKKERQIEVQKKENANLRLTNIFALTATALALLILALLYNRYLLRTRQQQLAIAQEKTENQRIEAEKQVEQEKNKRLQEDIDFKNRELSSTLLHISQKNKVLSEIREKMEGLSILQTIEASIRQRLREMVKIVWGNLNSDADWERFKAPFEQVHPDFFKNLSYQFPELSPKELKFCAYLKMNLDTKEIANLLNISVRGIEAYRYRIRKKMDLESEANLLSVMQGI